MTHQIISGIGILTTGAVAGAFLYSTYSNFESPATTNTLVEAPSASADFSLDYPEFAGHTEALEEELNHYREWTFDLENKVAELETRLNGLEAVATSQGHSIGTAAEGGKVEQDRTSPQTPSGVLSVAVLVDNGVDPQLAAELVKRKNRIDMQQLELRDQAIRDGTFGQEAYFKALRELNGSAPALRAELGDDVYDRYLYTLGQPNRVVVTSVIPGSPAEQYGIQSEDIILSYDDKRIFNWSELRDATTKGERGEYIQVEIWRNDNRISLLLPRGPLGVRMGNKRLNPLND